MANRYLIASGDSENPAIYDGGTFPAVDDVLRLNGFTWTVTANRTIAELRRDALAPAVASEINRQVIINNGVTLTVTDLVQGNINAASNTGLIGGTAGGSATVISSLFTGQAFTVNATETINAIGSFNCNVGAGSVYGGMVRGAGTMNMIGPVTSSGAVLDGLSPTQLNITGSLNVTGDVAFSVQRGGNPTITINGPITVGGTARVVDTTLTNLNVFTHYGSVTTTGASPAFITKSPYYGTGPFINNGEVMALECRRVRLLGADNQWSMIKADGSAQTLRTAGLLTGYPAENKVEDGYTYGPSSEFEGTMEPWDAAFAQALATAQRDLQLPSILSAITAP